MTTKGGFWRKVAGAFVEFDESRAAPGRTAPPPASLDDQLASTEKLLQELSSGRSAFPPDAPKATPPAAPPGPASPPAGPPAPGSPPPADVSEGTSFSDLYTAARVPPVHHSAEQLLAILDGLAAMPPDACRMAVQAMDAADDRWTVADVLSDARAKIEVLTKSAADLTSRAQAAADKARADHATVDAQLAEGEAAIQEQIAQLQAELDAFRSDAAAQRAEIDATLTSTRDAVARETTRVQGEIARLGRVRAFLEPIVGSAPSPSSPR